MGKRLDMADQLRRAIKKDGRSLYAIRKASTLKSIGPLQRFVAREHGLTLSSAEKLADSLGLKLVLVKKGA